MPMLREFRVLNVNTGAHRVPSYAFRRKMQQLGNVIRRFLGGHGGRTVVFRTTVPGFSGCERTRHSPPFASLAEAEAYLAAHPFYEQHEFVPVVNRIATEEVERAGGRVLDVYPASILRRDDRAGTPTYQGSTDCLHYATPFLNSSLFTWAQMLGEMLLSTPVTSRK